jgi:hypothetical protein
MENKKIKLLAVHKNEQRSEYVFPREQKLFSIIRDILPKLGFKDNSHHITWFGRPVDKRGESVLDKEESIKDKFYNERISNFSNEDYSIDIIFFSKKVVLIFNYKKDRQQKIAKIIGEYIIE